MAAIDNYNLGNDPDFYKRVISLALEVAHNVSGEQPIEKGGASYYEAASLKRNRLANEVMANPINTGRQISLTIVNNPAVSLTIASTDNDIEFAITSSWDDMSRVIYQDNNPDLVLDQTVLNVDNNDIVTLKFDQLINKVSDATDLKEGIKFASDGVTFVDLQAGDSVIDLDGISKLLTIKFAAPLTTATNKIKVLANTIRNNGDVNAEIITDSIDAT